MKSWIPLALALAFGANFAHADCSYPKSPDAAPDGSTATLEQMVAAKHDFDRYNGEMNSYLECLKLEMDTATPKDPSKLTTEQKKKVDEQQKVLVQKTSSFTSFRKSPLPGVQAMPLNIPVIPSVH